MSISKARQAKMKVKMVTTPVKGNKFVFTMYTILPDGSAEQVVAEIMRSVREHGGNLCPGFEQPGGLAIDNLAVGLFGRVRVVDIHELHDLTGRDRIGRIGENLHDTHAVDVHHHLKCT